MLKSIVLACIPLFVAVDAIGVLPMFVGLTSGCTPSEKKTIILQSMITALCLAISFIFLGKAIFQVLGITMGDFMIGGGVVLFSISLLDMIQPGKERRHPAKDLGAVPIGTPLVVGPAVLTTSLMSIDQYGVFATLIALVVNVILAGILFLSSDAIMSRLGEAGAKAISKIMSLFLAAIAVMLIRKGIMLVIQ